MTKATHKKTIIDLMKNQKRQQKKAYGLGRQNLTGYTDVAGGFTTMHQVSSASSGGANTDHPRNISTFANFLDPIAFWMHEQLIYPTSGNNNTLDLSEETGAYTSHWIWSASGSEELEIISNAEHSGQILFIESVDTRTPKIVDRSNTSGGNTGNIRTLDGNDLTFPNTKTIVVFMFSTTSQIWHQVTSPVGGSGSGATRELDNLQNTAVNADIIPASASSVDLGSLTKPYDVTYSDEVVFVTEGAISHTKPTIGWGNSARGMTFSMPSLGSTQNAWTWEEAASVKMSLTNGGLLTVGTMLSTSLLRAEGDTELGNATSDDLTITARVDSDIIPKTTQSHDLGDTDRWWDKLYSMYVYTNRVTLSGSNAQIDMGNYPINNCGDIDFDGTEDIKRSGTTMLTFGSSAITTGDYKDLVLGSAAYLQVSATSSTAPSGAFDGFFYVKNTSGSFVKVPYYTP